MQYVALLGIVLAMLALVAFGFGVLIGISYHPENASRAYTVFSLVSVAAIVSSLPFFWRLRNVEFGIVIKGISIISGSALTLIGAYLILTDSGDFLMWCLPFMMGVCLLFIFFEAISPTKEAS